jgi:hypothetical protein
LEGFPSPLHVKIIIELKHLEEGNAYLEILLISPFKFIAI